MDGVTTNFVYDGDQILAEYDQAGTLQKKYVYGSGIDEPILMQSGANKYYYNRDGLGSVSEITDNAGTVIEKYSYDVYGKAVIKDASDNMLTQSAIGNRYGFTGRELDYETGLYHYRARAYSPELGRFLQTDPIGYYDATNLYQYTGNSPNNFLDPLGLCKGAWYDRLAAWSQAEMLSNTAMINRWVRNGGGWRIYAGTAYLTITEFGMNTLSQPQRLAYTGEGIGGFIAQPSLATAGPACEDISTIAFTLASALSFVPGARTPIGIKNQAV